MTRAEIVAAARAWIGTPYVTGAALRGVGCDCVGLIRGTLADLTGRPVPNPPGWRPDWSASRARPLIEAAARHLDPVPVEFVGAGDVVVFRHATGREAHCGILSEVGAEGAPARVIHAAEGVGVVEVPLGAWARRISYAARFPGLDA